MKKSPTNSAYLLSVYKRKHHRPVYPKSIVPTPRYITTNKRNKPIQKYDYENDKENKI